jgi:hypothetical protein
LSSAESSTRETEPRGRSHGLVASDGGGLTIKIGGTVDALFCKLGASGLLERLSEFARRLWGRRPGTDVPRPHDPAAVNPPRDGNRRIGGAMRTLWRWRRVRHLLDSDPLQPRGDLLSDFRSGAFANLFLARCSELLLLNGEPPALHSDHDGWQAQDGEKEKQLPGTAAAHAASEEATRSYSRPVKRMLWKCKGA